MARIAFIGAGSTVFTRNLVGDVLRCPELADTTTFALMDVDPERLETSEAALRAMVHARGVRARARVAATLDRRAALDGADYVVTSFQVGGYRPATETAEPFAFNGNVPHTGGELALDAIAELVDTMIAAHGDLIPALR
jgi:alpha-galactosidase